MVLCQSPEAVQQEVTSIVILHCSGLLHVVVFSEVEAGVEAGGSLYQCTFSIVLVTLIPTASVH